MPEKIEFVILFTDINALPPKRSMIDMLFSLASPWLRAPETYMALDWQDGTQHTGLWQEPSQVFVDRLGRTTLLFVYETAAHPDDPLDGICVSEGQRHVEYSLFLERTKLDTISFPAINGWLLFLYRQLAEFSRPLIASGSEFGLQGDIDLLTDDAFMQFVLSSCASCYWIVVPYTLSYDLAMMWLSFKCAV